MTFIIRNFFGCVVLRFHQINLKDIFYLSKLLAGLYAAFALLETGSTVKLLRLYRLFSFGSLRPLTPASIICPSSSLQIGCLCSTWSSLSHADGAPPLVSEAAVINCCGYLPLTLSRSLKKQTKHILSVSQQKTSRSDFNSTKREI